MGRMLHAPGKPATGQKVFLAVAVYDKPGAHFSWALAHTTAALAEAGIGWELAIYTGNCHVDSSRNRLVRDFLKSDCTDYLSIDADVAWPAQQVVEILGYDREIVAGIYPKKHGDDTYPVLLFDGEVWSDKDGLIEVKGVPTGFLRIRRQVLQRLADEAVHYNARNEAQDGAMALIFERQVIDGTLWGGDYVFCRKARAAGFKIYIAPEMRFEHSGEESWTGCVGAWLRQRSGIGLRRGLTAFANGTETIEDAMDLFDAWNNPYAVTPLLMMGLGMTARATQGPVLECGGGLSTLVLAATIPGREVHVLEDSEIFAERIRAEADRHGLTNLVLHVRPLVDGWYDTSTLPNVTWGLVFVDGPRRTTGSRADAPSRIDLSRSVVIADDVQADGGVPELRTALERTHNVKMIGHNSRAFAICAPKPLAMGLAAE